MQMREERYIKMTAEYFQVLTPPNEETLNAEAMTVD